MNIQKRNSDCPPPPDPGCDDCQDKDNATQKSITKERLIICNLLYETEGMVEQQQTKFDGENEVFKEKKCMFLHTEENYRRYRNLEICAGTELLQTNDSIKANVADLNKWNTDLNKILTDLTKQIKDAKSKFADLKSAACKLDDSITDKCNAAQWKALTGKTAENCNDTNPKPPIDACKDAESEIDNLICYPKGLGKDIDYIFQSSTDVTGIQIFSNIDTLEPLQKSLSDKSNAFEKLISETMKTRKSELDKLQDDLVVSVKSITQSAMNRNSLRSKFEGYYDAVNFLCCPSCGCVVENPNDSNSENDNCKECNPRLHECETAICRICGEVQNTFCCDTPDNPDKKCD